MGTEPERDVTSDPAPLRGAAGCRDQARTVWPRVAENPGLPAASRQITQKRCRCPFYLAALPQSRSRVVDGATGEVRHDSRQDINGEANGGYRSQAEPSAPTAISALIGTQR
jgi:hypothetical protein